MVEYDCGTKYDISWAFQIAVIDTKHIWIACSNPEGLANTEAILFTSDKGKTWEVQFAFQKEGGAAGIDQLIFTDENNGLIVVDEQNVGPQFYRTSDGGKNWMKVQTPPTEGSLRNRRRVDFVDTNSVFFINTNTSPTKFYGTSDLGAPWDTTHFSDALHVEFYNRNIGLVVGHRNVHRTTDGGKSWEDFTLSYLDNPDDIYWGYGIHFSDIDPKDVWLLDYRNIHFSSDTGRTWANFPYDIDFLDDMYIYNNSAWVAGGRTLRYFEDATSGNWQDLLIGELKYPIVIGAESIGGFRDEILVLTGSF